MIISYHKVYVMYKNRNMRKISQQQWANILKVVIITAWAAFMYDLIKSS
jgi:hypothetical protein